MKGPSLAIDQGCQYVELIWSYTKGNINQSLNLPLNSTSTDVRKVTFISVYSTTAPIAVGSHTAMIFHWNQNDMLVPQMDGKVVLADEFLYLPLLWNTYTEGHVSQTHQIDETVSNLLFWVTYEDNTPVVLSAADARFAITMLICLSP